MGHISRSLCIIAARSSHLPPKADACHIFNVRRAQVWQTQMGRSALSSKKKGSMCDRHNHAVITVPTGGTLACRCSHVARSDCTATERTTFLSRLRSTQRRRPSPPLPFRGRPDALVLLLFVALFVAIMLLFAKILLALLTLKRALLAIII